MSTETANLSYTNISVPAGSPVPVLYYFVCRKWPGGGSVGAEQTFLKRPTSVSFSLSKGQYFVMGGQRDATGREIGTPVQSSRFHV